MASTSAPSSSAIEKLFEDLPDPIQDDKNNNSAEQDHRYKEALENLLRSGDGSARQEHSFQLLKDTARRVLGQGNHGIRVAFIQGISELFLATSAFDDQSAESRYFKHCQWIYRGRKESQQTSTATPDTSGEAQPTIEADLDDLSTELTRASVCGPCGKTSAPLVCNGCIYPRGPSPSISTGYCSKECQRLDWPSHKLVCVARKHLQRTVHFMKSFFLMLEKMATDFTPASSCEGNGMTFVTEGPRHLEAMQGDCVLHPFARDKFASDRHASMALHNQYKTDLYIVPAPLIVWLWTGFCKNVEEISVHVKNVDHPLICNGQSTMTDPHIVFRVTLDTGEKFAVDLAGGRFGWSEPLMHWDHFEKQRIWRIAKTTVPGLTGVLTVSSRPFYLPDAAKTQVHGDIMKRMVGRARKMIKDLGKWPDDTQFLSERDFTQHNEIEGPLLALAREVCTRNVELAKTSAIIRLYPNRNFTVWVAMKKVDAERMKVVWMTDEEVEEIKDKDEQALKQIWVARLDEHSIKFRNPPPSNMDIRRGSSVFDV